MNNHLWKLLKKSMLEDDLTNILIHFKKKLHKAEKEADNEEVLKILPPLDEARILAFEQKHQLQLPKEYRQFIQVVCAGVWLDAEPNLYSLDEIETCLQNDQTKLIARFSYQTSDGKFLLHKIAELGESFNDFYYSATNTVRQDGFANGCMVLADYGCNDYTVLVVNGEEQGKIWRVGEYDFPEYSRLYDFENGDTQGFQFGFLEWFCYWADLQGINL